jgi:hypothetical protein
MPARSCIINGIPAQERVGVNADWYNYQLKATCPGVPRQDHTGIRPERNTEFNRNFISVVAEHHNFLEHGVGDNFHI